MDIIKCDTQKKVGATFSAVRGLVNFPQYQQNFIDLYCFLTSSHFFKVVYKIEQNIITGKLRNLSDSNNIVFHFFIFGDIFFGCP